ncbi:MAG: DUF2062 domain-containing protein [Hydrogenophaga sp.]
MKERLRQWLPSPERIQHNRWLRWMGPALHHPRLWHFSRKGIALGLALGIFFGLLIPVAQIPFSAAAAVVLRANLPMAVASTLVTNPVTFGPVYFAAYKTGQRVLQPFGLAAPPDDGAAAATPDGQTPVAQRNWAGRLADTWDWLTDAGKPLVVGLALFACVGGVLAYALTSLIWAWHVRRNRARRLSGRG